MPSETTPHPGMQRQFEIYMSGLNGSTPEFPIHIAALEQEAKAILPPESYDYVAGGAVNEETLQANLAAFAKWRIVPRMLRDVTRRERSVELLGSRLPAPILLAPVGVQEILRPEAEKEVARAAASVGLPFV